MKNILVAFLLLTSVSFSQTVLKQNLLSLKNSIKENQNAEASFNTFEDYMRTSKKNAGLAMIYSLLLPGMGELYAGDYSSGKYFTIADAALWGVYFGLDTYSNWKMDKYISFATSNAGVNTDGKNSKFYGNIGNYMNITKYNDSKARDRNFSEMYSTNQYFWKWNSEQDRKAYRSLWTTSEQSHNALRFIIGGMILNRIASAINAVRIVARHNRGLSTETSWNISAGLLNRVNLPQGVGVSFQTQF